MRFNEINCPIIINCRDRLMPLKALVEWCENAGHENIIMVDNASTYGPLLEYYASSPHRIIRLPENIGHTAPWVTGLISEINTYYIVSDPDTVPHEECPKEVLCYLHSVHERYPWARKVGLGLYLEDIPDTYKFKYDVLKWEAQFWSDKLESQLYSAPVDTSFALYPPTTKDHGITNSIRTAFPYVARHLSWYINSEAPTEEDMYYRNHANPNISHWSNEALPSWFRNVLN